MPLPEHFEDCQKFLVVDLIVELSWLHSSGEESNWVQVAIFGGDLGDDSNNSII